jgi:lon-related putative ATP-dependent protease
LGLLRALDPDFRELFKVIADFDEVMDRDAEGERLYCRLIAGIAAKEGLRPFDASACARAVDRAARLSGDAERLTLRVGVLADLLREADFRAGEAGAETVSAEHVSAAIAAARRRADLAEHRLREAALRDILEVETEGTATGRVNGLAVVSAGDLAFGRPSRIAATARMGSGEVIDVEREAELGGRLHSKGVLTLSACLAARYARDAPVSLSASLVFEQSHAEVDGDSASAAEMFALLSAISGIPLRQDLAVTGAISASGAVQAIGGVNEKVEGFFDLCAARGLTGTQGVLIPAANAQHLMLREDVVTACAEGRFSVTPIRTVDEGIARLTGRPAGVRDAAGDFPEGSVNAAVEARLIAFAEARRAYGRGPGDDDGGGPASAS